MWSTGRIVAAWALVVATAATGDRDADYQPLECGRSASRNGKIVGGEKARRGEFPWQVALKRHGGHICGGSLLTRQFVLTAAHCLRPNAAADGSGYSVAYGSLNKLRGGLGQEVAVELVLPHPQWRTASARLSNDIALLKLATPVRAAAKTAAPVCLPPPGYEPASGGALKVSGWGRTREGGTTTEELMFTMVPVIENEQCRARYKRLFNSTSMFCAMYPTGGKDACQGDSGGPAVINHGGVHFLAGVVSWGEGCARLNAPGVYTKVATFTPWIESVLREHGTDEDLLQVRTTLNAETLKKITEPQTSKLEPKPVENLDTSRGAGNTTSLKEPSDQQNEVVNSVVTIPPSGLLVLS